MGHANEELLRKGYAAFGAGDMETIASLLADDVVWHYPGTSPISGTFRGKDEVLGWLGKNVELSEGTLRVEPHDVLGSDEHAVGLIRVSARRGGKSLDDPTVQVCHIVGGMLTEVWVNPHDQAASDDFWS